MTPPPLRRRRPLEVIHELLLSFAEAGANVLRLKGGGFLGPAFFLTQLSHINSPVMAVLCMACSQGTNAFSQSDGTYMHTIESLVHRVCKLARESGEDHQRRCLRASSLQRLSAMVQFMAKFSYIFVDFDEIVHVTLDNYEPDTHIEDDERGEPHHNWVDEVVRSEGRVGVVGAD
ncbi:unnamed protein product [Prunus armeniaca]|uniref:Uncharacterized protein n=1 Tax=Prunus armeniaca TaxID=36596 RepID=A0A6J5WHL2_PRUAR|nr:unnamed protein product [Prunus armeniaca]